MPGSGNIRTTLQQQGRDTQRYRGRISIDDALFDREAWWIITDQRGNRVFQNGGVGLCLAQLRLSGSSLVISKSNFRFYNRKNQSIATPLSAPVLCSAKYELPTFIVDKLTDKSMRASIHADLR